MAFKVPPAQSFNEPPHPSPPLQGAPSLASEGRSSGERVPEGRVRGTSANSSSVHARLADPDRAER